MSRFLEHNNAFTRVIAIDEPGPGNACHEYAVEEFADENQVSEVFAHVKFQNGPIKDVGVNGLHNEDLLSILIDRLEGFQSGKFACRENALALTKLQEASHWLEHRIIDRQYRGVEGTNNL